MELETHELGGVTLVHCKGRLTYGDEADNVRAAVKKLLMQWRQQFASINSL